ncbi:uncharacterized protein LOC122277745 isoform X1 [Carya illinoinensis]|uniref:uncharacterized protein LOC122277745 isoform X1 n=1 Tax=Carya illinoinensis TaxID=32201 RepID=UPI001C71E0F0|nr:uncharacterized protein LOC122277745 isoform X1 [Carya illinoinensis]XP_042943779.1 uncharacterized protein LOC122277745 isoform X1 [Carya illinoinensis]XP_042943780.1 uncharacterized protein LOC122277745 isoform X1 [Carya illinoinensis]
MLQAMGLSSFSTVCSVSRGSKLRAKKKPESKRSPSSVGFSSRRKELLWRCVEGCGACCKLKKGSSFVTPEEIFSDPVDIELYKSLTGPDGWCIHFDKGTRTCSVYNGEDLGGQNLHQYLSLNTSEPLFVIFSLADRPYFCRVEPDVFESLYGVSKKNFNKDACSFCRDTIKEIYGSNSKEFDNFNCSIRSSGFS